MTRQNETPTTYEKRLADNRKPHPSKLKRSVRIICLGPCRQPFLSSDPKYNRRCANCIRLDDGILSGSASVGSSWHRGRGGA